MADQMIGNKEGVTNVSTATGTQRSNMGQHPGGNVDDPRSHDDIDNADNIGQMRARLAVIDAGFYTATRLNTMTMNDMVYALRVADHPTSIKQ